MFPVLKARLLAVYIIVSPIFFVGLGGYLGYLNAECKRARNGIRESLLVLKMVDEENYELLRKLQIMELRGATDHFSSIPKQYVLESHKSLEVGKLQEVDNLLNVDQDAGSDNSR